MCPISLPQTIEVRLGCLDKAHKFAGAIGVGPSQSIPEQSGLLNLLRK